MRSELDQLEAYLIVRGIPYERKDQDDTYDDKHRLTYADRHQIIAYTDICRTERAWDAICQRGSYGYEQGLLEIRGRIIAPPTAGDSVEGWLTAADVIRRIKEEEARHA